MCKELTEECRLIYAALLTSVVVRVVEQMAGVARVSDLSLFWAIAGAAAGLMWVTRSDNARALAPARGLGPTPTSASRRSTNGATATWRWGRALVVVTAGSPFIWQKNVSYIRGGAELRLGQCLPAGRPPEQPETHGLCHRSRP